MNRYHHTHTLLPNQCGSTLVQIIDAPLPLVWSILRQFNHPQTYQRFVKSCTIPTGDGTSIGSVREIQLVTGFPAKNSTEILENLDDELYLMMVTVIGGEHRLANYKSTTTLHRAEEMSKTTVIESYVVDIPADSCEEDTCVFADTVIRCNLKSLAHVTEKMATQL